MLNKSPFAKFDHVGIVVKDIDKAVEYYESLGLGPFFEHMTNVKFIEWRMRDKPIDMDSVKNARRIGRAGQIKIELIQPVKGESIWKEFLETKGEGIQHLAFSVDNIERETNNLKEKGLTVLFSNRTEDGGGTTYFDTREVGGIIIEIVQWPTEMPV
ncbi:VOC family protein [Chloroflexota bacterium]